MSELTDSLWLFPKRETVPGQPPGLDFQGGFIPQVADRLFQRYTGPGDVILDWFFGSGTSGYVAQHRLRFLVGVDVRPMETPGLDPNFVRVIQANSANLEGLVAAEDALRHFSLPGNPWRERVMSSVGRDIPGKEEYAPRLAILHPPYADIINFNGGPDDLSGYPPPVFLELFRGVAVNTWAILPKKAWAALVIGDVYYEGEHYPLGFMTAEIMRGQGFKQKCIIVKDIQNNQAAAKQAALKEWRHNAHGTVKFKHEYVFVFRKG